MQPIIFRYYDINDSQQKISEQLGEKILKMAIFLEIFLGTLAYLKIGQEDSVVFKIFEIWRVTSTVSLI